MSERVEPVIGITVEGQGWDGEVCGRSGEPASVVLFPENCREALEPLRAHVARRLKDTLAVAATLVNDFDFEAPTMPPRDQMAGLVAVLNKCVEHAAFLRELSPDDWPDDDDEGEGDPEPDPDPSEGLAHDLC